MQTVKASALKQGQTIMVENRFPHYVKGIESFEDKVLVFEPNGNLVAVYRSEDDVSLVSEE